MLEGYGSSWRYWLKSGNKITLQLQICELSKSTDAVPWDCMTSPSRRLWRTKVTAQMPAGARQVARVSEAAVAEGGICEDYLNFFQKVFAVL